MSLTVETSAVKRIEDLRALQGKKDLKLRITVEGGGCSGFQYKMELTETAAGDESVFAGCVVTDSLSLPFLDGAVVKFEDGLIGSAFKIDNPNATSGCGCGVSFGV